VLLKNTKIVGRRDKNDTRTADWWVNWWVEKFEFQYTPRRHTLTTCRTADELMPHRAFFKSIRNTCGQGEFFVGLFAGWANLGLTLTHDLRAELSCLGIDLNLDVYDREDDEIQSI